MAELNGHAAPCEWVQQTSEREQMLRSIETALRSMTRALLTSGFSDYEAGQVGFATRAAITEQVKARFGGK